MRSLALAVTLVAFGITTQAASHSPFLQLQQTTTSGETHIVAKNVAHSPIVAYVIVAERGAQKTVFHGVYTAGDSLPVNSTVNVGDAHLGGAPEHVYVDFVRLADGSTWGEAATDEAKKIGARFQNS